VTEDSRQVPDASPRNERGGGRVIDRVTRRVLPYPRDVAFANLLRGGRDLILGRRPRSIVDAKRAILAEERLRIQRSRDLLSRGDPAGAAAEAVEVERLDPENAVARGLRLAASRNEPIRFRAATRLEPEDIAAAQAQLRAEGHARPIILLYHQASPDSPFQSLLYRRAWSHGMAPIALHDLADLSRIDPMIEPGSGRILHLHWVNRVLAGAAGPDDARRRLDAATATLDQAMRAGWSIAWTVHNVLPHDSPLETEEAALRQVIADRAALIHIMARSTAELAAPWFRIPPERTIHVAHPSFRGAYPDVVDQSAARYALGLPGDARVVSLIGGLKPYKGLDLLLDAFVLAARDLPELHLVIAGRPSRSPEVTAFMDRAVAVPNVHLHARMIPSDDLQLFLRSSDAIVLPYVRILNSAQLMLALAFDLPVIAPDLGGIPETVDETVATLFPAGDVRALAAALGAVRPVSPASAAAARQVDEAHDADRISEDLMVALRRVADQAAAERNPL
jgi:glycosyltransferase involved in cell wall biosynthesis